MNRDNVLTGKGPLVGSPVSHIQTVSEKQETAHQKESSPRAGKDKKKTFKELMDEVKATKNARDQKAEKEQQQNLKTGKEKNKNAKFGLKKASKYQRATVTAKDIKEPLISTGERTGSAETIVMTWEETRTDSQVRAMNEEIDRNQLFIRNWLERLIQENKKLLDLEKLRDYLKTSLAELLKNNIIGCEIKMIDNTKILVLKIKSGSSILICEIREKENRKQGENPFVLTFSSSSQASPEETMEKILEENYKENYNEDVPSGTIVQPKIQDRIFRKNNRFSKFAKSAKGSVCEPSSFLSSKRFSKDDESGLSVSLVVTEPDSVIDVDDTANAEKSRSEMIDQHIDEFIANLPPNKDWTRLKYIFKAKFAEKKTITPKMAKIYLSRLEKMMINNDEIATNIMSKKVIMNFTETTLSATVTEIASSETSVLNFVKDITWAPLTYHKVDLFGDNATPNSAEVSDTATQTILSMLAMAVGAVLYHVIKGIFAPPKDKEEVESNWTKAIKTFFIWFGSGMSIPGWNALQYIGRNIGLNQMNLSTNNAGYFSSLFPGIPDGPMQGITSIISANTVNHTWNKFQFKIFLQQLLIFVTFGAFPGAIWQIIYQVVTGPIGSYNLPNWAVTVILGFTLATVVYICNVAYGSAYERFINKSHLIIELEAVDGNMELRLDSLLMDDDFDSIVSYNGRVGAPRKTSIVIRRRYHRQSL